MARRFSPARMARTSGKSARREILSGCANLPLDHPATFRLHGLHALAEPFSASRSHPISHTMKWWKKALILTAIWVALIIGAALIHTEVILKEKYTPMQDEAISEAYGVACGFGVAMIWAIAALRRKRRTIG